ncbi:MAG: Ig-like domain-containing protein [Candidatus Sulfotelmatobacter sp.]
MFASETNRIQKIHNAVTLSLTALFCLFAASFAFAQTTVSPASLAFGNVVVGNTSPIKTVKLTNNQSIALNISSITAPGGGYAIDPSTTCANPGSLAAGANCTIAVTLTPTALGALPPGSLTISTNATNSPNLIPVSGTGSAPVVLSPASLSFAAQTEGTTSAPRSVTVTNKQSVALTISGVSITGTNSGDFGVTGCPIAPASVPATSSCTLSVTFTPTGSGTRKATLSVADGASGSPQTINLRGSGIAPVTISPTSITTFSAPVGTTSAYKTITITNADTTVPLLISSLQFNGDFIQSATTCPIAPAALGGAGSVASCTVSVEFDPTIGGTRDGQLQVYDNAGTSPQVVNLQGKGTSPLTISPPSLSFSSLLVGTESAAKTITLTNHESESESFTLALTSSLSAVDFLANSNCSTGVIAANSSCLIYANFTPSSNTPSERTGTLTITDSAPGGSPLTASLKGSATATNPPAAVAVVSPGAGAAGTTVPVTITGNGWTNFSSSSVISFTDTESSTIAAGITVSSFTAISPNEINATLTLAPTATYGARNIKVVTPLSGGGNEIATLKSAFIIADPNNVHTITSVTPAFGTQGQSLTVSLTAVGTSFQQGVTSANFGSGITVNSLTITDATDALANITISNTTTVGYRTITMVTDGEIATSVLSPSGNPIFQIGPNSAALVSVSPNSAAQGASLPVTITATGTHFLQSATTVSLTGGIIVGDIAVVNQTTLNVQLAVPANATVGLQNVTVSTGGEIASLANAFAVTGATPALLSVVPSSAAQGQTLNVVITGNAFTSFNQNAIQAEFTGEIAVNSITVNSLNSVTVNITVSPNAAVGSITANLTSGPSGSATIFPFAFTVTPSSAQIVSVTPNSVPQGGQAQLTVVGLNTSWVQGTTIAAFSPIPGSITVNEITINSPTSATLNISVPANQSVGTNPFYMATGGQVVYSSITVYANTPSLTMSPANGLLPAISGVTTFTASFTGQFTHFSQTLTLPVIAGEGVTLSNFTVNSPVSATATVTIAGGVNGTPTATGPRLVTFTTGGEIVTTYFNVTSTPVGIISVTPYHAPQSTTLNVEIVGLNTHFTPGNTQVLFGPQITVNSVTVNTLTDLTANITTSFDGGTVPTPSGWQSVYVNTTVSPTSTEQVIAGFSVDAPASPTLVSVIPSSAAQGSTVDVTITGSLTNWVQGETEAILGAGVTVANLEITSATTATATISVDPTAPVGGNSVIMITGAEIVSGTGFSVTPSAAEIVSVSPSTACNGNFITYCGGSGSGGTPWVVSQLQTATLNVVGVGTHWLQGETTVSFGPGVVVDALTVTSPLTATVQITVLSSAPVGFATLTTYTGGEVVTLQQAIDIEEGFPTLLAIAPGGAQQGATLTLQVLGRFTNWQQGITSLAFNQDITVNSVTVIDSDSLTASITVSPWAYVDYGSPCGHVLTVTSGSEQESTAPILDNFCVAQGAAQIDSISSLSGFQGETETVTITGGDTHFLQGVTTVSFGDPNFQVGQITVTNSTTLSAPVAIATTATPGYKTVTVSTYGEIASQQYSFTVIPDVPTLNEAIPNQAEQGVQNQSVELIGQYSNWSALSTATFGAGITVVGVTPMDATHLTAVINIDPLSFTGSRLVTVTTPGVPCTALAGTNNPCPPGYAVGATGSEIDTLSAFTIIPGPAIISNVSTLAGPPTGNEGQEVIVNITGSATHWAQNFTQFYIAGGGYDLTINSVVINNPTSATVDLSISPTANPGARSIYMVTNGESLTDSGAFVVTGGVPVVTYLSPNNGEPGASQEEVTINGLYTEWTQATTTVSFGPGITVTSFQVDDATHIEALINIDPTAQLGYRTVVVQTGAQGLTSNFLVQAPPPPPTPFIWYESPSSGLPGQTFTITFEGSNTSWNPNPTSGTMLTGFNSSITLNTFQVTSPTTALANITIDPAATASTSDLTLTTGSEVENAQFSVVIAQPTLTIVDPGTGMQGAQNLTVNILGQFTNFDSTTTFDFGSGITVNSVTILGPGIASVNISIAQLATLGGRSVIATTDGTAVGGAGFSVTASLALISAVAPNLAAQGASIAVDVTGQNTHWDGSTVFTFGSGIVASDVTVNSTTTATMTLTVPALAPLGTTYATAQTGGEIASIAHAFVVTAGTPLLLSSGPGSVPQQSTAVFTILSQATNWSALNPPTVSFGPGITLTNIIVTSNTSMTVQGFVQATTTVGPRNLTVSSGTQVLGLPNAVYITAGPAVINDVVPSTGGQGQNLPAVQINGTNTNWQQGVTQLTFPDVLINSFAVNSPTSITANITVSEYAPAGQVSVTATTLGEVATGVNVFTITQTQPELLAVVPSSGAQGVTETVNLTGQFTDFVNGTTTANFGAGITVNSVTVSSATAAAANVTVQPTATLGPRNVSVTTGAQVVSLNNAFQVTVGPAAILSLTPATGGQGNSLSVLVTGSQTNFASGVTTAAFGGGISVTGISVTDALHATVNITIPTSTAVGAYDVSLTTGGEVATILGGFTVTSGSASLSVVSPPTGTQGTTLNVDLTGVLTNFVNGTSVANFGAGIAVNSTMVTSATTAVANITISQTATIGSRNVSVTTGAQVASITGGFSVLAGVPALLSASPSSAQAGTTANVVITGEFTTFQQGFSTVALGDGIITNVVTVSSLTQLTANVTIPSNASVGNTYISVTTSGQTVTLNNAFAVTAGTPVITEINPNIGTPGNSVTVTIYGQYTNWVNGTTTASFGPGISVGGAADGVSGPVTVNSATNLTAQLAIASNAALGPVDVITTTGGEVENVPGGFTIQPATPPSPTLLSLSPGPNVGTTPGSPTPGMPLNSAVTAVFSEPMSRTTITTATVLLYLTSNPSQGNIPVTGAVNIDPTGRVVTFVPNSLLALNSTYNFQLTSGIQSATGVAFVAYSVDLYTIATAATAEPTVIAANPPALSTVGTNVTVQLEFSGDMNQNTQSGLTVSTGGNPVTGTYSWNSAPNCCSWGPGTVVTFTPSAPLAAGTTYTVNYSSPLADTAGNALLPGSFSFNTGSGPDTVTNNPATNFNGLTNVGTNFKPTVTYSKPVNPIDIYSTWDAGTLLLYNADSGKYVAGTVTVAPNGLSASFTPSIPLLPDTYYYLHQAGGNYDADGNTLNGLNSYFTTGSGTDMSAPTVTIVSPANTETGVPLNAQVLVRFSSAINSNNTNVITVTPSSGSPIAGTATLASDLVTLTFVPAVQLQGGTVYTVDVSGYTDVVGNLGIGFTSSFTTSNSSLTGGLTLTSAIPSNGSTGVATNATITMNFNNPIDPATVNTTTLPVMIGYNSNQEITGSYAVTGNQIVFTPASPFPTNTQIYVGTCNGPLDLAGDSAGGCYTQLMNFTTGSTATAPPSPLHVMAFTPAANATNVGLRAPVAATFNRSVNLSTINPSSALSDFALFQGDGQSPWCTSYSHSQDDATLSFTCYALPSSSTMTAILNSNIMDWQGDPLQSFSSQFSTSQYDSNTNGSIITTRPGNGASGVSSAMPIVLYANLPINSSSATNGIQVAQNNVLVPGSVQVLDNGYTLEFTPSTAFTAGALIQWWTTSSLYDATYNTPINAISGYFYVASSTATLVPAVQTTSPPAYSNPVPTNTIFDVQFNTPISASTITASTIYLYDSTTGLHPAVTYSQPQPNEILMVPTSALPVNHYIYVYITNGLQSATSVPATATDWYEYTGTTVDSTLPTVVSAVPFNGATGVGVNVTPGVVFNKPIDQVSLNSNTFQVLSGGTPLAGGYTFNSTDTRVEFVPNAPLPPGTALTMSINGVADRVGHPVAFTSTFTTAAGPDFTAPTVVWSSVTANESIPTNSMITIQFSESMDVTTFTAGQSGSCGNFYIYDYLAVTCIATTLSWNADQSTAYLTPNSPLSAGREYELVVNGGTDLAGNQMTGISPTFYADFTLATTAPTVINFNPINESTGLGTNAIIEAQFSAPIDPTTVSGVTLSAGASTVTTTPVLSVGNTVLQLVPAVPLSPNTAYTLHVFGVSDPAGNPVAPVNNSFTTGATYDISAPSMTISDPVNGTTVGTNVTLKMVFNKPLNPITVSNSTFRMYLSDTSQFIPLTVSLSASGLEVTMTPQIALLPNTYYYFQACCGFQDEDGNNGNGVNVYFYTNGGTDTTGPTVTVTPPNAITGVPLNAQVTATLNVPMDPTSWSQSSIQLLKGSTPAAGTVSFTNNQTLTFVPTANLAPGTGYTVNVSGFTDANGNPVVPYVSTFTTGTAAATPGLTVTSTNIPNGTTGVSNTQPIILTFSQILDPNTVNSATLKVMNGWNSNNGLAGTYSVSGSQVTFTPNSPYPAGAAIYVGECGGPMDVLGDVFQNGACYSDQILYFTVSTATESPIPLQVVSVTPASGATNVGRDQSVAVTFNNSILSGSANGYNSQLYAGQTLQDVGTYSLSADNRTLTFSIGALANNTTYTIEFPAGGISDMSGNTLSQTYTSTFSTEADPATAGGGVSSTAPGTNATGVPTNSLLTLYLNRQANPSTVPGSLTVTVNGQVYAGSVQVDASGYQVQYTPSSAAFPNGATVQWFFSGASDVYGNALTSSSGYFYTAAAINPATAEPTIVSVSPECCAATLVPTNAEIDIQYSQPINPATVTTSNIFQETGPAIAYSLALASPTVVRITGPFNASTQYGFCASSSVQGTNGVAAQSACYLTYFTTAAGPDTTSGTVTIGPPTGSQNVGTNAYIRLQFSKPADRTTVNSTNVVISTGGNPIPGSWTYNYSGTSLVGANFYPLNPLPQSTSIQVAVSNILDYAGNEFSEPTVTFTTAAQPDYTTPSVSLDFGSGQTGVATNASFTCLYSEPMDPSSITPSGTYLYSYVTGAAVPVTYSIATDMMAVTMAPTSPLFTNSEYYYECANAVDLTGNAQSNGSSYFYTGNNTVTAGPVLVYANPPNGMTNVPVNTGEGPWNNTSLNLLFSEPVATNSLSNITLTPQGGSPIAIAVYPEDGNYIASVQLPYALSAGTTYTYNVAGVTDLAGNPAIPATSTFTTGSSFDFTNAAVIATVPASSSTPLTGVPTSMTVTFNELLDPVLLNTNTIYPRLHNTQAVVPSTLSFAYSSGTTIVTLTPLSPLAESTIYDIYYYPNPWWLTDIAGNNATTNYGILATFTTGTTAAVNGACGTANGGTFTSVQAAISGNLCSKGSASGETNNGTMSWTCNGLYGGTNASCSATITPAQACLAQPSGLVSWWPGNDNPNDIVGGNNGTLENGVGYALGEVDDAFNFNGSDQYVLIGQPVPTNLQIQNDFTMSAWIYVSSFPGTDNWATIAGSWDPNADAGIGLYIDGNIEGYISGLSGAPPGSIDFSIGSGSSYHRTFTTTQIPLNQWVLVTAVASANNPSQIYYDGVLQPSVTPDTTWNGSVSYTGSGFAIGQTLTGGNWPFTGLIDELQVYDTALTATQVQGIYNAGSSGVCQ